MQSTICGGDPADFATEMAAPTHEWLTVGDDGLARCRWGDSTPDYRAYHDTEWGFPVGDDRHLFEKLSLEAFQSGLSWLTILRKRDAFRRAFADFDFRVVAGFAEADTERLLGDAGIIRHRGKIEAVINNARRAVELTDAGTTLASHVWSFEPADRGTDPAAEDLARLATTPESTALAKDLKRRGWKFVGPTTAYAFMQSMGIVNDHMPGCHVREAAERARAAFARP